MTDSDARHVSVLPAEVLHYLERRIEVLVDTCAEGAVPASQAEPERIEARAPMTGAADDPAQSL